MNDKAFDEWIKELEGSGNFRVLRRLADRPVVPREPRRGEKIAVIVDTETTGLDVDNDEAIEIAMIAFTYTRGGKISDVIGTFSELRDPSVPIPAEVTKLTGITPRMVRGCQIDQESLAMFIEPAALIVAHNAAFDRPICERISTSFSAKAWACSATDIDWRELGFESAKLSYLVNQFGLFYEGHRALTDCWALLEILDRSLIDQETSIFSTLLSNARMLRFRVWVKCPYELRKSIRARGYRWNSGESGGPRAWYLDVVEQRLDAELSFLTEELKVPQSGITQERMTAFERYRSYRHYE